MQNAMPTVDLGISVSSITNTIEAVLPYMQKIVEPIIAHPLTIPVLGIFFVALVLRERFAR